jgi:hypothetical protein
VWFLAAIYCLNALSFGIIEFLFRHNSWSSEMSGLISSGDILSIMFCGILAMQFFIVGGWAGGIGLLPAGEFILVRPVPRHTAYFSRMLLYFIIIMVAPFLKVGATFAQPDLRISLQASKSQSREVAAKVTLYQNQFPNSSILGPPQVTRGMLVIPFGNVLVALWEFWLAVLLALALQWVSLLILPSKIQIGLLMAISVGPMLMISFNPFGVQEALMENVFFAFVHYWAVAILLTSGVSVLVQRMALKRIRHLEFI